VKITYHLFILKGEKKGIDEVILGQNDLKLPLYDEQENFETNFEN
jgi:hypothetical protein